MSSVKRDVQRVGPNSFLFFNLPDIFYFLTFDIYEILKIKVNLIKMKPTETYVFEAIIPFNALGTDDPSPQDSLKNITYLICNKDFKIQEDLNLNKIYLSINSKNKASIELFLYNKNNTSDKDLTKQNQINSLQNKIQELLNTISMQEQKINELRQREDNHKNLLNKMEEITGNITKKLNEEKNNNSNQCNNRNNNQYNNNQYNPYSTNNNNNNFGYGRAMTLPTMNYNNNNSNLNNNNFNGPNITVTTNTVYSPYLPNNSNINNLLTRPEYRPPPPMPKVEKKRTINLDNYENYRP